MGGMRVSRPGSSRGVGSIASVINAWGGGRESPSNALISEGWQRRTTQTERTQLVSHHQKSPPHTHTHLQEMINRACRLLPPLPARPVGYLGGRRSRRLRFPALFIAARNSDEKMENIRRLSAQLPPRLPCLLLSAPSLPAPGSREVKRTRIRMISKASLPAAPEGWVLPNPLHSCQREGGGQEKGPWMCEEGRGTCRKRKGSGLERYWVWRGTQCSVLALRILLGAARVHPESVWQQN